MWDAEQGKCQEQHLTIILQCDVRELSCRELFDIVTTWQGNRGAMHMNVIYKKATIEDIGFLTKSRIEVLKAANRLADDANMAEVEARSCDYYKKALSDGSHTAYLVFDGDRFIGAGGISYYRVMPTYHNSSGDKAYIMNMYTHPDYRRLGIAYKTLELLVADAKKRGIKAISLEATDMGRPLYEKFGFVNMNNEMELPE